MVWRLRNRTTRIARPIALDNDEDGISDAADECPDEAEDLDDYLDDDGCVDPMTLLTILVVDAEKNPIDVAKIKVSGPDTKLKGGPVLEEEVAPGAYHAIVSAGSYKTMELDIDVGEGAPHVEKAILDQDEDVKVVVSRDRIELKDKVNFDSGKATIREDSFSLLDDAVTILEDYPEIKRLRIEGHTDAQGADASNLYGWNRPV